MRHDSDEVPTLVLLGSVHLQRDSLDLQDCNACVTPLGLELRPWQHLLASRSNGRLSGLNDQTALCSMGSCGSSQGPRIVGCQRARTRLHDPQTYTRLLIKLTWILGLAMPGGVTRLPLPLALQSNLDNICDHPLTGDKRSGSTLSIHTSAGLAPRLG